MIDVLVCVAERKRAVSHELYENSLDENKRQREEENFEEQKYISCLYAIEDDIVIYIYIYI